MIEDLYRYQVWEETMWSAGLVGNFHNRASEVDQSHPDFILTDAMACRGYIEFISNFVLGCASYTCPGQGAGDYYHVVEGAKRFLGGGAFNGAAVGEPHNARNPESVRYRVVRT